jgi:hypothetical protein
MLIGDVSSGNKADEGAILNTQLHIGLTLRIPGVLPPFPLRFA